MYTLPMPSPPGEFAPPRDEMEESTAIVVGTDLVQVSEVGRAMERFGERYLPEASDIVLALNDPQR